MTLRVLLVAVLLTACGNGPSGVCSPGHRTTCVCADGSEGAATCDASGEGYVCACGVVDAGPAADAMAAPLDAAIPPVDAMATDAGAPRDAHAADAPSASMECGLVAGTDTACPPPRTACRVEAARTYCGPVELSPLQYADACMFTSQCDRGLQCLRIDSRASMSCNEFCSIAAPVCRPSRECVRPALVEDVDGLRVTLPPGVGLCR